jgi:hypothetical protein
MPQRIPLSVSGVFANQLAAAVALTLLQSCAASAVDNCFPEPNARSLDSSHWSYRIDRASGRKCWFIVRSAPRIPQAEAAEVQPPAEATQPPPPFQSFFSSLSGSPPGGTQAATQQDSANVDARTAQPTRPNTLRNTDDERRARVANRPNPNVPPGRKLQRSPTEQRPGDARTQAEQDALFEEFLRWKRQQTPPTSN